MGTTLFQEENVSTFMVDFLVLFHEASGVETPLPGDMKTLHYACAIYSMGAGHVPGHAISPLRHSHVTAHCARKPRKSSNSLRSRQMSMPVRPWISLDLKNAQPFSPRGCGISRPRSHFPCFTKSSNHPKFIQCFTARSRLMVLFGPGRRFQ